MQKRHRLALGLILLLAVLALLSLGVFLALGKSGRHRESSTLIPPPPEVHRPQPAPIPRGLLASTIDAALLLLDLASSDYELLLEEQFYRLTAFDYCLNESVYYGSARPFEPVRSVPELGSPDRLSKTRLWSKTALAVDFLSRKLYVLDAVTQKLNLVDFSGEKFAVLLAELSEPKDLALDPPRRLLLLLQAQSILRANMDGSEPRTLLQEPDLRAFALDRAAGRVYYSTSCSILSLSYANANGSSAPLLVTRTDDTVTSLALLDGQLYFVTSFEESGRRSLTGCSILGNVCKKYRHDVLEPWIASRLQSIKAYEPGEEPPGTRNPCASRDAGCEYLCVLSNGQRPYSCLCKSGYRLNADGKSCSRLDDYLLYVQGDEVRRSSLEPGTSPSSVLARLDADADADAALRATSPISFDYSFERNLLLYADQSAVHLLDLAAERDPPGTRTRRIALQAADCALIPGLDWLSGRLYYARNCRNQSSYLLLASLDEPATFRSDDFLAELDGPVGALAVHPHRGVIFFTGFSRQIGRFLLRALRTDATELELASRDIVAYETGLCLDFREDRLYWLSNDAAKLVYANFEDFQPRAVDLSHIGYPRTLSLFGDWLYVSNLTEIWRVNKITGADAARILPASASKITVIHDAKVFARAVQPIHQHP